MSCNIGKFVYPLGSVVLINDKINNKKVEILISSYGMKDNRNNASYEYAGFEIPIGYNPNNIYYFNNQDIICPIFIGYKGEHNKKIRNLVSDHYLDANIGYLPIGSVVEIANKEKVLITGLCLIDLKESKLRDYIGKGIANDLTYRFNRDEIVDIDFVGYQGEEFLNYKKIIDALYKELKDKKDLYKEFKRLITKEEE